MQWLACFTASFPCDANPTYIMGRGVMHVHVPTTCRCLESIIEFCVSLTCVGRQPSTLVWLPCLFAETRICLPENRDELKLSWLVMMCLWVITVEAHAAHCRRANATIIMLWWGPWRGDEHSDCFHDGCIIRDKIRSCLISNLNVLERCTKKAWIGWGFR